MPPQLSGMRKPVVEDKKRTAPIQSIRRSLSMKVVVLKLSLRKRVIITAPTPANGRLIQKIQRQVTFCANPPPSFVSECSSEEFCEVGNTEKRPSYSSNCPHCTHEAHPLPSLSEGNHVCDNDLSHTDDPTPTNSLDGPSNKDDGEIVSKSSNDCPYNKKDEAEVQHWLPTKDVAEGPENRLHHSRCEQE